MMAGTLDNPMTHPTLVHLLRARAAAEPNRKGYMFLPDGEEESAALDWGELDRSARSIAAQLRGSCAPGDRALLLYPAGLEFISAYMGCLYAGVIAVPAPAPRSARQERGTSRLHAIVNDARPAAILVPSSIRDAAHDLLGELTPTILVHEEACDGEMGEPPALSAIRPESLAFLQYTSGSCSAPKGVMVRHGNLMHNLEVICRAFNGSAQATGLTWLPHYHDMGLLMQLQALYAGCRSVIMPPTAMLQRPVRWLEAITRYRVEASGGPNFAYALCARTVSEQDKSKLDLSCWKVAYNAAEPIHARTLDAFTTAFASCGFSASSIMTGYGLAETTLVVSCAGIGRGYHECPVRTDALRLGRINKADAAATDTTRLVSSGMVRGGQDVLIVDPETRQPCAADIIGEVWVRGASVAAGYWKHEEMTREVFAAQLVDRPGAYLRTGDLGFFDGDQLIITGRLKDVIIIRGLNHYPQDIEHTTADAHPALAESGGAAFSVEIGEQERLIVVHEVERAQRNADVNDIADAVRRAVAEHHELSLHALVLLKPGHLPRTTSGKVRRSACREDYLAGTLHEIARWEAPDVSDEPPHAACTEKTAAVHCDTASSPEMSAPEIAAILTRLLADAAHCSADEIDPSEPFVRYGLDSAAAMSLSEAIRAELGPSISTPLTVTVFWDYPSIDALSRHLADATRHGDPDPINATEEAR